MSGGRAHSEPHVYEIWTGLRCFPQDLRRRGTRRAFHLTADTNGQAAARQAAAGYCGNDGDGVGLT